MSIWANGSSILKELFDMDDFSKPRLPRPVAKVEVAKAGKPASRPMPSDAPVQKALILDFKVREPGKRKKRQVSSQKQGKLAEEQLPLLDEE